MLLAFLVWITLRGSLPNYLADMGIGQGSGATGSAPAGSAGNPAGPLTSALGRVGALAGGLVGGSSSTPGADVNPSSFGVTDLTAGSPFGAGIGF